MPRSRDATITREPPAEPGRKATDSLFCLALQGVSRTPVLTDTAGGLLPRLFTLTQRPRLKLGHVRASGEGAGRYIFCDTFRQPQLSPTAARTFARLAAF
jgi:hypothetical protein